LDFRARDNVEARLNVQALRELGTRENVQSLSL
jgi:hypothetical protein